MKRPRVGFVLEQGLGHVAYAITLRHALNDRRDVECVWLEVGFEEARLGKIPVVGKSYALRGNVRARRAIAAAHRERPLDALFVHTSMIGVLSADFVSRIPTLLSIDATPINYDELAVWYAHPVGSPPVETVKRLIHKNLFHRARQITAWSAWAKNSLVRDYAVDAGAVTVIHPGTTISSFPEPGTRGPRREGPMRVLFVGGDFVRKGGDMLLEVFRQRLRSSAELHLVTGADVASGDGVFVYRGVKPHSETLLRLYAEADVFVLPTRGDCLAVVLGEAMASSLPIVTTRVGAHAEAVEHGESGFVIDKDDATALGDHLERMARDPALRIRLGAQSRRIGEARFDMKKNANQIADMLFALGGGVAASPEN